MRADLIEKLTVRKQTLGAAGTQLAAGLSEKATMPTPSNSISRTPVSRSPSYTGGGRGIRRPPYGPSAGRKRGYKVCISYLEQVRRRRYLVKEIRDAGGTAIAVQADVGNDPM